jgi:glycosyltransferase involved in cell wall biosynthesis
MTRTPKRHLSRNQPLQDSGVVHGNAMPKVLIVSYHFPPDAAVGAIRAAKFAKYLPEFGWQPYVLTVKEEYYDAVDGSRMSDVALSERIFRTKVWPNPGTLYLKLKKWLYYVTGKRHLFDEKVRTYRPPDPVKSQGMLVQLRRFVNSLLGMAEGTLAWVPPAILKAIFLVGRYQIYCLYTSGPPHSAHLVGLAVKYLYGTRWVADFRDPWTQCPQTSWYVRSKLSDRLEAWMEKQVVMHADKVVSVTERMGQSFRTLHPQLAKTKFVTILNGYDPEDFADLVRSRSNAKFRVSYLGSFYLGRTPAYFLKAARELIDEGTLSYDGFEVRLIGQCRYIAGESVETMVHREGLSSVVRIMEPVPYKDALRQMADSDLLLLFAPAQPLQIPGKAFEYLASGAHIIAFTGEGATADLIRQSQRGFVVEPDSVHQIKTALKVCYQRCKMNGGGPRCSSLSLEHLFIYHRRTLTKDLVSVLG